MTARRTQSSRRDNKLSRTERFRFKRTDSIGAAAAEDDGEVLKDCYVDTGALQLLQDIGDRRQIVLGRTGTGKSALLTILEQSRPERVIKLSPEHLALTYVANSTILNFFGSIGVNLDPFFKLLWRHVLTSRFCRIILSIARSLPSLCSRDCEHCTWGRQNTTTICVKRSSNWRTGARLFGRIRSFASRRSQAVWKPS